MALTLNDYRKQAEKGGDAISARIIKDLQRESRIMDLLSFKSIGGLSVRGVRWQSLPAAAYRKVGTGYTESTGRTEEIQETISMLGGDILVDRVFEKVTDVLEDPVVTQMSMKAESVARVFNDTFGLN